MEKKKNIQKGLIIILIILNLLSITYIVFNKFNIANVDTKATFVEDITKVQEKISYYLGTSYSDTFGAYTKTELITGLNSENKEIKDTPGKSLKPIVNIESKTEINGKVLYELNQENIEEILKIDLPTYNNIKWYIQDGELIKVKFDTKPSWWTTELNSLEVGK